MKNSEATKQPMLPDTSTCVADHNDELSKDSVIDYVRKLMRNPYQSPAIEQGLRGREPSRIPLYKKTSSLFYKDRVHVIRRCIVHYLKKNEPSLSELRKCLPLAFGKQYYIAVRMSKPRPQLRRNKSSRVGDSNFHSFVDYPQDS